MNGAKKSASLLKTKNFKNCLTMHFEQFLVKLTQFKQLLMYVAVRCSTARLITSYYLLFNLINIRITIIQHNG